MNKIKNPSFIFPLSALILSAISLAFYILSTSLIFLGMDNNANTQRMFLQACTNGLWMYIILLIFPLIAAAHTKKHLSANTASALMIISIIYLCLQAAAAILACIFLFSNVPSFYSLMFCSFAGKDVILSAMQLSQGFSLSAVISIAGELCAFASTLMCVFIFRKKRSYI